ncbi:U3 small nucleolar RNA-associated protein 6-domain-containing protein [Lentinula detonsa]|uniref:U3 small nucleolar RNA-associated protein 6-domain-containing protein n=1 Tax=Lentinula detonsa TaxID=2804962 RepID=A0AA38US27_9AGAR|nr:U3 small nucleolar RNA-associated protein 6-domain-containing protein [Lentinula detonsa]
MLDELKDLVDKKVFTVAETKQIMKQRSTFEAALVRRIAKKADFLRYASYEMDLEHLRRKRVERLKIPKAPVTVSDFALVRRQFHIFERALKRFKSDVGLWIEYIQLAKKEGARSLVGRITARALQLHPNAPSLYILAASHELTHLSPSTARSLLQRGVRFNSDNVGMWTEYVKMELGFVESLRRRWDVLGINGELKTGSQKIKAVVSENDHFLDVDMDGGIVSAGVVEARDTEWERLDQEGDEGAAARKQILDGVIIKAVIDSAVQALPQIELFESLNQLITAYPSTPTLRESLISHLDGLLRSTLPQHPRAIKILYTRLLTSSSDSASQASSSSNPNVETLRGRALIEGVRRANELLISIMSDTQEESVCQVYAQFALDWSQQDSVINPDDNLKLYVLSSLQALIHRQKSNSPSLLCAHIKLVTEAARRGSIEPAKALNTARRYTSRAPESAAVWIGRLTAMKALNEDLDAVGKVWREARRSVSLKDENVMDVWTWGMSEDMEHDVRLRVYEDLLNESVGDPSLHEQVLLEYVTAFQKSRCKPSELNSDQVANEPAKAFKLQNLRHMQSRFINTGKVWQKMFQLEAEEEKGDAIVLKEIYELWRKANVLEATIAWAEWLLKNGKGKEASGLIVRSKGSVGQKEQEEMETEWVRVMEQIGCAR